MDKSHFIKLLHKYLKGNATEEERIFVEKYYNLFQNDPGVLNTLGTDEKKAFKNNLRDDIWRNIFKVAPQGEKAKLINYRYVKLAAAAVLVTAFISSLYFLQQNSTTKSTNTITKNEKIEPKKNRVIFLPDGSTVILSHGSKLNYPSTFDDMVTREVYLEGQAFFDIRHNKLRPFIVHTGNLQTKVLGTAFNIKAMPGEDDIVVTVKRGSVSVNDQDKVLGIITPNQQITYAKSKVKSLVQTVKNESYLIWKQEDLLIDNLTISEAARLMEDRYNVKIIINNPEVESSRFTTTFSKNATLEETLNSICVFNGLVYVYDKKKSIVSITP